MPVFEYKGFNEAGKAVEGIREADSPKGLRALLRKEGVFLSEVNAEQEKRRGRRRRRRRQAALRRAHQAPTTSRS